MRRNWRQNILAVSMKVMLAAAVTGSVCLTAPAAVQAQVSVMDNIRVALYLDLGSKYKSTTPAVTISSIEPLNISFVSPSGTIQAAALASGSQARLGIHSYKVKVLESNDWKTVSEAAQKLQATADKPMVFTSQSLKGISYQLYTGMYATEQAATEAAVRTAKTASAHLNGQIPAARGTMHLTSGPLASEAAAGNIIQALRNAEIDAFKVMVPTGSGMTYEVWAGEALNAAELGLIQNTVQAAAAVPFKPAGIQPAGIILREEAGIEMTGPLKSVQYNISGTDSKLWIEGSGAGIYVKERSGRTYRGALEAGLKNGQLYLVNELPFEQYLYSVVGAEVPSSWGEEALKAQAVAARSYALYQGLRFEVAHVVDTVLTQAYNGIGSEAARTTDAVNATAGEVIWNGGKVVEAVFSSNSGGMTADPSEVWTGGNAMFAAVESPGDASAQASSKKWYYILLPGGQSGYVREDNVQESGASLSGLKMMTVTANSTNVRPIPMIQSAVKPVAQMNPGQTAVILDVVPESGSYEWVRGPFTSEDILKTLKGRTSTALPSEIRTLEVTSRGPSGRVTEVKLNGQVLKVNYPDMFRSAFGGLPSTLFDIQPAGSYTVLGADGKTSTLAGGSPINVISGSGVKQSAAAGSVIMSADGKARSVQNSTGFRFIGKGNGHGLGLSQWGAKGMADQGYDYREILQHYYRNSTIMKD
ncbi:SpoIID/LytB domain-containing protein [Paenibacillus lemnae]|uniref:SpoIID/LytB domain-containing protein n=1 Tax=Paenibacillus lemnae TaxID=1330551 RepID=A0A848M7X5_PAELE|nr:SpoIID/LytB domain-containing protein [Paenibacillus lemnae]NMO96745.1 SpoIID/LytB domain-containing protein [Paenibacillus lemnae]